MKAVFTLLLGSALKQELACKEDITYDWDALDDVASWKNWKDEYNQRGLNYTLGLSVEEFQYQIHGHLNSCVKPSKPKPKYKPINKPINKPIDTPINKPINTPILKPKPKPIHTPSGTYIFLL